MTLENLTVGTELPPLSIEPITRKTLALFAGASGDHQPAHLDIDAARAKGYEDVFAHGMLSMAYLARLLTNWVPQHRIRSYKARFLARVPVKAEPICKATVVAIKDGLATLELVMDLPNGTTVVRGEAVIDIR